MANGPWGGGGNRGGDGERPPERPSDRPPPRPRRPGEGPQIPEIDQLVNRGREQLRVLMGGRGGPTPPGARGDGPRMTRGTLGFAALGVVALWGFMSVYTVQPNEQSVELFLGEFSEIGTEGLNFAPWPLVTYQVVDVTSERTVGIGAASLTGTGTTENPGLMLTTDANIVNIGAQVVWNINDPTKFLFNIRDAEAESTVQAVTESVMREIIAASQLAPILNRDRGLIADTAREQIQATLDSYDSGISIIRVNLAQAEPPEQVVDAFRDVQAAEQERDRLQREADAYANQVTAQARGQSAQIVEQAEAYRAQRINDATGQASRFTSVLAEYEMAPDVTRERLYLETMERVLGRTGMIILDPTVAGGGEGGGQGVVPFLPLDQLIRTPEAAAPRAPAASAAPAAAAPATTVTGN